MQKGFKAFLFVISYCFAFSLEAQTAFPSVHAIPQVVHTTTLRGDTTHVSLKGYFSRPSDIDSVTCSKWLQCSWDKKANSVAIISQKDLKPISELKLWSKGFAYSIVLKKRLSDSALTDPNRPIIHASKLGRGSFTVSLNIMRFPFSIACYWQNFKLGKNNIKKAGDEVLITLPEEAKKMDRSYIRVLANDDESMANDLLIPLDHGEVVNDPKQLTGVANMGIDTGYMNYFAREHDKGTADKLSKLRTDYIALSYGESNMLVRDGIIMIKRSYFSQTVLLVLNRSKETKSVETGMKLDDFKTNFDHKHQDGKVELPPSSFEVFTK